MGKKRIKKDRSRWRPWLLGGILGVGAPSVVGIILITARVYDVSSAARHVEEAAAKYRAAGFPWEMADVARKPPVPPEQNAALPLAKLCDAYGKAVSYSRSNGALKPLKMKKYAEVLAILAPSNPFFDPLAQIVKLPKYERPVDFDADGYPAPSADLYGLSDAVVWTAIAEARLGNLDRAESLVVTHLRLNWLLATDGTYETDGGMAGTLRGSLEAAENYIEVVAPDEGALRRLDRVLASTTPRFDHDLILRREIYRMLAELRRSGADTRSMVTWDHDREEDEEQPTRVQRSGLPLSVNERGFATRFFEMWAAAKPIFDRTAGDPERRLNELRDFTVRYAYRGEKSYCDNFALSGITFDSFDNEREWQTGYLTLRALIAALQYKLHHGTFPSRIEDLPGRWPDPYSGKSLRIMNMGSQFRVYSIGKNHVDDGGNAFQWKGSMSAEDDISAWYPAKIRKY